MNGLTYGRTRPFSRVSRHNPCPICDRPDWCLVYHDGTVLCMRVTSDREAPGGLGGWWHQHRSGQPLAPMLLRPTRVPAPRTFDPDTRHAIYSTLFDLCPLSDAHCALLMGAGHGLTLAQTMRYGTLPAECAARADLRGRMASLYGAAYYQTPGHELTLWGILVPRRDVHGRIHSCQIRRDHGDPRYVTLSSTRYGGPGAGSVPHIPLHAADLPTRTVWITEGPKKADVATDLLGALVVGLSGVNTGRQALPVVKALGAREVVVAFDQDTKPETQAIVERYRSDLAAALHAAGVHVSIASWDGAHGKGLDDLLQGGRTPDVRPWTSVRGGDVVMNDVRILPPAGLRLLSGPVMPPRLSRGAGQ